MVAFVGLQLNVILCLLACRKLLIPPGICIEPVSGLFFFIFSFSFPQGLSVLVNGELGVVRFIGTAEFAEGVWLGVEMRKPGME